jgi:hypothetical protein
MRRAVHHGTVTGLSAPAALPSESLQSGFEPSLDFAKGAAPLEVLLSTSGTFARVGQASADPDAERNRHLAIAIMQRIESRLPGRVRKLTVRVQAEAVVLEGECATYYTKQLAQHAALGILEDEHLENAIVVTIGR